MTMERTYYPRQSDPNSNYRQLAETLTERHANGEIVPLYQLLTEVNLENTNSHQQRLTRQLRLLHWTKRIGCTFNGKQMSGWNPPGFNDD